MLETGSQHATAVGMHINASKYSYLVNSYPVIDGEPFEEVDKIKAKTTKGQSNWCITQHAMRPLVNVVQNT